MARFDINYQELSNTIDKNFYKLSEVSHKLEKVAFDLVKFKNAPEDELWQIQSADDGDYIVARYSSEEDEIKTASIKTASKSPWEVLITNSDLNIFYKSYPISKVAVDKDAASSVKKFLPNKLATDKVFVKALLNTLTAPARENIYKLYPELL